MSAYTPILAEATLAPDIQRALTFVPTFAAILLRVGAMFVFAPLFGSGRIPKKVKAMLAVVLSLALSGTVRPVAFPETIYSLTAAAACELMFGLAMGMILSFVFVAAQWAGEIIGQQLGFTLGSVFDPQYGGAGSVVSDLLYMLTLCIFLALGGHHAMLIGLHESFSALPLFGLSSQAVGLGGAELVAGLLNACTVLAMKLVAPTIAAMLISDVVLGFVSKTMPQLNVMSIGMNVRSLLGLIVLAAGLVVTSDTMSTAVLNSMEHVQYAWTHPWKEALQP